MNQSDKIRYVKRYNEHPKRTEYEKKKIEICNNKPIEYYLITLGYLFFIGMFVFYGWLAFSPRGNDITKNIYHNMFGCNPFLIDIVVIIGLGILNIYLFLRYWLWASKEKKDCVIIHNEKELNKLNKYFADNFDLYYWTDDDLKKGCGDYNDIAGCYECTATKEYLSDKEYIQFCSIPGKCFECSKFITLYEGPEAVKYHQNLKK